MFLMLNLAMRCIFAFIALSCFLHSHGHTLPQISVKLDYETTTFKNIVATVNNQTLTLSDRLNILNNAALVLEEYNPHRYIHLNYLNYDPAAKLRDLKSELSTLSNFEFHRKVIRIFSKMNDYHSVYFPPEPLKFAVASLGFSIEKFYNSGNTTPTYIISNTNYTVIAIDGTPVHDLAVELGTKGFGSNLASREANGMRALTIRSLAYDAIPHKKVAIVQFSDGKIVSEADVPWTFSKRASGAYISTGSQRKLREFSKTNFVISEVPYDPKIELYNIYRLAQLKDKGSAVEQDPLVTPILVPDLAQTLFEAFEIKSSSANYRYINIKTFFPLPPPTYKGDFVEYFEYVGTELYNILENISYDGIVIDISENGGGAISLGKYVFELLSDKNVPPIPIVSRATNLTVSMYSQHSNYIADLYRPAVEQSYSLGEQFTGPIGYLFNYTNLIEGFFDASRAPQVFKGKFILLTSAQSYSTSDMLASWVRDTNAGLVVGLDDFTGGGGASVIDFSDLQFDYYKTFASLPPDVDFSTANIRIFRNGGRVGGTLLENFGVRPDKRYYLTYRDVVDNRKDLLEYLGGQLSGLV